MGIYICIYVGIYVYSFAIINAADAQIKLSRLLTPSKI